MQDLFETLADQPSELQNVFEGYELDALTYDDCTYLLSAVAKLGYTFDYGLDGTLSNLRKVL